LDVGVSTNVTELLPDTSILTRCAAECVPPAAAAAKDAPIATRATAAISVLRILLLLLESYDTVGREARRAELDRS
jgi:hypothetical protein